MTYDSAHRYKFLPSYDKDFLEQLGLDWSYPTGYYWCEEEGDDTYLCYWNPLHRGRRKFKGTPFISVAIGRLTIKQVVKALNKATKQLYKNYPYPRLPNEERVEAIRRLRVKTGKSLEECGEIVDNFSFTIEGDSLYRVDKRGGAIPFEAIKVLSLPIVGRSLRVVRSKS